MRTQAATSPATHTVTTIGKGAPFPPLGEPAPLRAPTGAGGLLEAATPTSSPSLCIACMMNSMNKICAHLSAHARAAHARAAGPQGSQLRHPAEGTVGPASPTALPPLGSPDSIGGVRADDQGDEGHTPRTDRSPRPKPETPAKGVGPPATRRQSAGESAVRHACPRAHALPQRPSRTLTGRTKISSTTPQPPNNDEDSSARTPGGCTQRRPRPSRRARAPELEDTTPERRGLLLGRHGRGRCPAASFVVRERA